METGFQFPTNREYEIDGDEQVLQTIQKRPTESLQLSLSL